MEHQSEKYPEYAESAIVALCKKSRNYRAYSASWNIVKKVWNRGMGAIDFIRVYPDRNVLAINKWFYNRTDVRKIEELKSLLGGKWSIVWCKYGYPDYYNNDFSLKYAIKDEDAA